MASQIYTTGQAGDSKLYYQDPAGAYKQIADTTELQNLAKAGTVQVGGQRAILPQGALGGTPSNTPTTGAVSPTTTPSPTIQQPSQTNPTGSLEVSPGVYKASAMMDYYNNELERNRPQYEQAQTQLGDINKQIQSLYGGPSLQETYNQQLSSATAGIDQQLLQSTSQLKDIDTALAGVEQEVRNRIGQGQAPESYIQAEIARQSTPLINQRNAIATNIGVLQDQKSSAVQNVQQGMQYAESDRTRQLSLLDAQRSLAKETVDSFNTLIEKGAAATDKEKDDARQMFSMFLQQSPDFLTSLSKEEYAQLQQGIVPYTALAKMGDTIAEQKLKATAEKNSGQKEATRQQIISEANKIIEQAAAQGMAMDFGTALAQARSRYAAVYGNDAVSGIDFSGGTGAPTGSSGNYLTVGNDQADGGLGSFMNAIAKQESGGRYNAIGPATSKGQRAYGKYQVMDFNIPSWTKAATGTSMTPQQFLNSPEAQEAVAKYKFQEIYNKHGNWADVASVWFSGRPVSQAGNSKDVTGTTVPKYVNNILAMMGQPSNRMPNVQTPGNIKTTPQTNVLQNKFNQFTPEVQAEIRAVYTGQKTLNDVTGPAKAAISGYLAQLPKTGNAQFSKITATDKGRQDIESVMNMRDSFTTIENAKKGVDTGPIASKSSALGNWSGFGVDPKFQSLKDTTERLRASIQNQISGAALSEGEVIRLQRFIPVVTDNDQIFDQKLKDLKNEYSKIMENKAKTFGFKSFDDMVSHMSGSTSLPWETSQAGGSSGSDPLGLDINSSGDPLELF